MKTSKYAIAIMAGMVIFSAPGHSTDLLDGLNDPAPQGTAVNWSGFYLGGAVGYGNSNHDLAVNRYNGAYCYDTFGPFKPLSEFPDFVANDPNNQELNINGDARVANVPVDAECADITTDDVGGQYFAVDPTNEKVATLDGVNSSGLVGDVRAGADFAQGRFLFGVFGSYAFSQMEASGSGFGAFESFTLDKGDEWSVGGRLGYLVSPSTLLYALAAYTQTDYEFAGVFDGDPFSKDTTFDGVTVGGGIEFAVSNNVFLGVEGTHTFYGEETIFDNGPSEVGGFGTSIVDDLDETKVMGTLKIKLNSF
jgi:opacity protein-like surface antigen